MQKNLSADFGPSFFQPSIALSLSLSLSNDLQ
jgi:hypothetical protein